MRGEKAKGDYCKVNRVHLNINAVFHNNNLDQIKYKQKYEYSSQTLIIQA
jgi:hypothetical protein